MKTETAIAGNAICIYGASSNDIDKRYLDQAYAAGVAVAKAGLPVVCGGGKAGVMAAAIDGALSEGGQAIGVLPEFMIERGWQHPGLTELVVTPGMHARKETMAKLSRAAIAFPGGCGTLEELMEIITWRQLGLFDGNVVIVNINHYYDPLLEMLNRTIEQKFMHPDHAQLWSIAQSGEEAVRLALAEVKYHSFSQKIH